MLKAAHLDPADASLEFSQFLNRSFERGAAQPRNGELNFEFLNAGD